MRVPPFPGPAASFFAALLCAASPVSRAEQKPQNFAYVLQAEGIGRTRGEAAARLAACGKDWIILDPSFTGEEKWTPADISAIRGGKAGRKVLAYLSIGEAEDYRPYWNPKWDSGSDGQPDEGSPPWLREENPAWAGNYKVAYWNPGWQKIILGELASILRGGFDGVYLDIVDGFEFFEFEPEKKTWIDNRKNPETGQTFREDMVDWVAKIAAAARAAKPGFLVVPQNGTQLLESPKHVSTIDAVGAEDLFTEGNRPQPEEHTAPILDFLSIASRAGKPVLVIEYGTNGGAVRRSEDGARQNGFVILITDRNLKTLGRPSGR